jgi:hypothetical protein
MGNQERKKDAGKQRWDLLPLKVLAGVVSVLTFGAGKYSPNSWQLVDGAVGRYRAAMDRHWASIVLDSESTDPESGLLHAWHFACNALFLAWFLAFKPLAVEEYRCSQVPPDSTILPPSNEVPELPEPVQFDLMAQKFTHQCTVCRALLTSPDSPGYCCGSTTERILHHGVAL